MPTEVKIFEVTQRQTYELTTGTGGNRPIYIGSRVWREQRSKRQYLIRIYILFRVLFLGIGGFLTVRANEVDGGHPAPPSGVGPGAPDPISDFSFFDRRAISLFSFPLANAATD